MSKPFNYAARALLQCRGFASKSFEYKKSPVYYLEGGNQNGPTVVVFPGYSDTVYSWTEFMLRYVPRAKVFALDFPGYTGFSPRPPGCEYLTFEDELDVATRFLSDIVGPRVDFLVGNSLGGWLGMKIAARHPGLIGHFIAVNAGGVFTTEEELLQIRKLYTINSFADFRKLGKHLWHKIPPYFFPFSLLGFYQHTRKPEFLKFLDSIERAHFINEDLASIDIPVSVVWGVNDSLFGPHMAQVIVKNAPKARYFPIKDAGHMPQLEKSKEFYKIVNDIIGPVRAINP